MKDSTNRKTDSRVKIHNKIYGLKDQLSVPKNQQLHYQKKLLIRDMETEVNQDFEADFQNKKLFFPKNLQNAVQKYFLHNNRGLFLKEFPPLPRCR